MPDEGRRVYPLILEKVVLSISCERVVKDLHKQSNLALEGLRGIAAMNVAMAVSFSFFFRMWRSTPTWR